MEVNAIRPHLDGTIEISADHGLTWERFNGIIINSAAVESAEDLNEVRRMASAGKPLI